MADSAVSVTHDPEHNRYQVSFQGELAGFAEYRSDDRRVIFTHTQIDPEISGHGIGSSLVRFALDDVRRQGKQVTPVCPFVAAFIEEHDEYADLVA